MHSNAEVPTLLTSWAKTIESGDVVNQYEFNNMLKVATPTPGLSHPAAAHHSALSWGSERHHPFTLLPLSLHHSIHARPCLIAAGRPFPASWHVCPDKCCRRLDNPVEIHIGMAWPERKSLEDLCVCVCVCVCVFVMGLPIYPAPDCLRVYMSARAVHPSVPVPT